MNAAAKSCDRRINASRHTPDFNCLYSALSQRERHLSKVTATPPSRHSNRTRVAPFFVAPSHIHGTAGISARLQHSEPFLTCGLQTRPWFIAFIARISSFDIPPGSGTYQNSTVRSVDLKSSAVNRNASLRLFAPLRFSAAPKTVSQSFAKEDAKSGREERRVVTKLRCCEVTKVAKNVRMSLSIHDLPFTIYYSSFHTFRAVPHRSHAQWNETIHRSGRSTRSTSYTSAVDRTDSPTANREHGTFRGPG